MKKSLRRLLALSFSTVLFLSACTPAATESTSGANQTNAGESTKADDPKETDGAKETEAGTEAGGETGGEAGEVSAPGEFPILKEKETVTFAIAESTVVDYNAENDLTSLLEEKGNMDINFKLYPQADAKQKMVLDINSNTELPDALIGFGFNDFEVADYGSKGLFLNLNDYYENDAFYIKQGIDYLAENENLVFADYAKSADGNYYTIKSFISQIGNQHPNRAIINKVWLDKIGEEVPETTEDLERVLRKFAEEDMNGNGEDDEVPMAGSVNAWRAHPHNYLMNAFIYHDAGQGFILKDGKVIANYMQPEWREGLKFMNRLVSENLLTPLSYTQDGDQFKQMIAGGEGNRVGVIIAGGIHYEEGDPRFKEYVALPPLKGPEGVQYAVYSKPGLGQNNVITKYAKNPRAIFKLLDFMWSEEATMQARYGTEGKGWLPAEEGDVGIMEEARGIPAKFKEQLPWGKENNQRWSGEFIAFRPSEISDSAVYDPENPTNENFIALTADLYSKYRPEEGVYLPKVIYTKEEMDEIGEPLSSLNTFFNESTARFVTGDLDPNSDDDWNNYLEELNNIGIERILEVTQAAYDRLGS